MLQINKTTIILNTTNKITTAIINPIITILKIISLIIHPHQLTIMNQTQTTFNVIEIKKEKKINLKADNQIIRINSIIIIMIGKIITTSIGIIMIRVIAQITEEIII